MPATIYVDNASSGRGLSKLSRALSKLSLRSPTEPETDDVHSLRMEQIKHLKLYHANAQNVLLHVTIPPGLTKRRLRDYVQSISITPKGKAFLPQYSEIIPGVLFVSDHFTGMDNATLARLRITHVVSILHDPPNREPPTPGTPTVIFREVMVPVHAYQARSLVATIDDTVDYIDATLRQKGTRVLIHCRMGVQWAPSVVIAWFMRNGGCGYEVARDAVRRKREVARPGVDLEKGIKEWWALEMARPLFPPGRGGRQSAFRR